jgi:high-affinity nickel permease
MSFEFLYGPVEGLDRALTEFLDGAPLLVALGIAVLLGLRHASDPDHLVAVTSLMAAEDGDARAAARLGAWWGVGHAGALLVLGIPLIAFKTRLPGWLESGFEA